MLSGKLNGKCDLSCPSNQVKKIKRTREQRVTIAWVPAFYAVPPSPSATTAVTVAIGRSSAVWLTLNPQLQNWFKIRFFTIHSGNP